MTKYTIFTLLLTGLWILGCASLRPPVVLQNETIRNYPYIFIPTAVSMSSGSGAVMAGQYYSVYGSANATEVIIGTLLKDGFIRVPEIQTEIASQTLIVNYGESGRRNRGLGYTIEVTIQFVNAATNQIVCSCTAEGQGETEADDIRQAIHRCLSGLLDNGER